MEAFFSYHETLLGPCDVRGCTAREVIGPLSGMLILAPR